MEETRTRLDVGDIRISTKAKEDLCHVHKSSRAAKEERRVSLSIGKVDCDQTSSRRKKEINNRKTIVGASDQKRGSFVD